MESFPPHCVFRARERVNDTLNVNKFIQAPHLLCVGVYMCVCVCVCYYLSRILRGRTSSPAVSEPDLLPILLLH